MDQHSSSINPNRFISALSRNQRLKDLPLEIQRALADIASPRNFKAGQVIYLEGELAEGIYILESGWVKATRMSSQGREQAMLFLKPVEIFGDIAIFSETTYPGTVTALEDGCVWVIPKDKFLQLVRTSQSLAMALIHHLSDRVLYYVMFVEDLALRDVEARLANNLLQNAQLENGQLVIHRQQWTTFDEMAVRLGTVRDVLSRALKNLEVEGLLSVEKGAIHVLDPQGLEQRGKL